MKAYLKLFLLGSILTFITAGCKDENQPPTCAITNPADGERIFQNEIVDITVNAEDTDGLVHEVRFYIDDVGVSSDDTFPYSYQWSTSDEETGEHFLKAEVIDDKGGKGSHVISVIVYNTYPPNAEFSADRTLLGIGQEVAFTDLSTGNPARWLWDFGDGNSDTTQHPTHSYELPGEYTIELMVYNDAGDDSEIKTDYINVTDQSESEILLEYLESPSGGGNYANTAMPAIVKADGVKTLMATGDVYIIDVRTPDFFADGHIQGAVNVAASDVLSHLDGMDVSVYDKVAIVCYSGQTSGWVTNLARISGYDNVYSMKWGMSSWNADFDVWSNRTSNMYTTQFKTQDFPKGPEGDLPILNTGQSEGSEILEARVDVVLTEGFGAVSISAAEVYVNLNDYYIVNLWPESHYLDPGHIEGAMQYTPKESMSLDTYLETLPTDKTIVVYCYTGQTSANLASYLRVIGYDAKSLMFGANVMIYDELPAGKWSSSQIKGYDYVTSSSK